MVYIKETKAHGGGGVPAVLAGTLLVTSLMQL